MAGRSPRIFVSSTYYDLRHVRADIDEFGRSTGFEVVLFERGDIPYAGSISPEEACYREIEKCDILVSIVGGRKGTASQVEEYTTISQKEVKTALDLGRQVFIFVDANVLAEYQTWRLQGKAATGSVWAWVDSDSVFLFLEYLYGLKVNNAIFRYDSTRDIVEILRRQLLGLFQDLLRQGAKVKYQSQVAQLVQAVQDVERVREFLERQAKAEKNVFRKLLFTNHPLFAKLQEMLGVKFRIFFENKEELNVLLGHLGLRQVSQAELATADLGYTFWIGTAPKIILGISEQLFGEDGKLKTIGRREEWDERLVRTRLS